MKCSLKEFNEYRQWIRKLKLDELGRERRRDAMQIEEAKKERLEKIALERDPELLEIMRKRLVWNLFYFLISINIVQLCTVFILFF